MNPQPRRVVLASGNAGKLREFAALLAPLGLDLVAQSALGVPLPDEPFETFLENALAKARHASRFTGLPALADDSGICVDALGGRPGVRSARWASTNGNADEDVDAPDTRAGGLADAHGVRSAEGNVDVHGVSSAEGNADAANNARLLADLAPFADRSAHYYCVLVLVRAPDDPRPVVADGSWQGEVIAEARGTGGFGYDPHFLIPSMGLTVAELDADTKNRLSHRGRAMRALIERLREERAFGAAEPGAR